MKKVYRNKKYAKYGCPQNKREDLVWRKGYEDGFEVANVKAEAWRKIYKKYRIGFDWSEMSFAHCQDRFEDADLKRVGWKLLFLITLLAFLISVLVKTI